MKSNNIINFSLTIVLFIIILIQCISAGSEDAIINNIKTQDWQRNNVFFYINAYSDKEKITNQSLPFICYLKDVNLSISLRMSFWPLFIKIKVWNTTGLIIDGKDDHFYLTAQNFTGLIFHRKCLYGYVWYIYGNSSVLKTQSGY